MTLQEMIERKKELGYSNKRISELSGVPLGTVMKIFGGVTCRPRHETVSALERVLKPQPFRTGSASIPAAFRSAYESIEPLPGVVILREPEFSYNHNSSAPRLFTIDDYYALPEEHRVELIDGVFYDMAAPSLLHQELLGQIHYQLMTCQLNHPGTCRVYLAPCDVQLDKDIYTMVQPDLMVLCSPKEQIRDGRVCYGAPDMTLEVISPSSRGKDCLLKLNKYKKAGVRESWLVDPEHRTIFVYCFEKDRFETYSFEDIVPVGISGGECSVDFAMISRHLGTYYAGE